MKISKTKVAILLLLVIVAIQGIIITRKPKPIEPAPAQPTPQKTEPAPVAAPQEPAIPEPKETVPEKTHDITPEKHAENKTVIQDMTNQGTIDSIDPELGTMIVDPRRWAALPYSQKGGLTFIFQEYTQYIEGSLRAPPVTVRDKYTNKKLATVSFLGFKTYD